MSLGRRTTRAVAGKVKADAGNNTKGGRIVHTIEDVSLPEDLVRYAVAAQLARLDVPDRAVGKAISGGPTNLSHALAGTTKLSNDALRQLDEVIVALAPGVDHTGGLAQFGVRMRGLHDRTSLTAHIPPSWAQDLLTTPSDDDLHVLIQGSALLTSFLAANRAGRSSRTIRDGYKDQINQVVERLILVAGGPPTTRNIEAQILLGNLAKYAFDVTFAKLEDALRYSPLGFRVWRALTKLVLLSKDDQDKGDTFLADSLKPRLAELLSEAQQLRKSSIYPGRSLDLELAISTPRDWLRPRTSVTEVLLARAKDTDATLRERGTAAMGLWQRAVQHGRADDPEVERQLRELIEHLGAAEQDRPDIASGLRWVAATLGKVMTDRVAVCNVWPEIDEPWYLAVRDAAESLDQENIPPHVRPGTKNLFKHVILQNAGVERRRAIDTLIAGGWTEPVARALGVVLRDERADGWVRIRALFALGFLQHRGPGVVRSLSFGCEQAYRNMNGHPNPLRAHITELHTALFAVGDCLGVEGADREAREVRENLRPMLVDLVNHDRTKEPAMYTVARAIAYVLTFTAQPRGRNEHKDLSEELLEVLRDHPDEITRKFSKWTLDFRFGPDGEVRPLLRAAG
ncbi:MAG: hypothetical protein V7603_6740 [Micromonosporaceae bacterium]